MDKFLADYFFPLMGVGTLIAIGLLLYIIRGQKSADTTVNDSAPAPFEPVHFEPVQTDVEAEVRMLVDFGNNAEAIRVIQEKLGFDLQDAKDLVKQMAHGTPVPMPQSDGPSAAENDSDAELRQLVSDGKLITAINLVREQKGLGLKEAKAYIDRL